MSYSSSTSDRPTHAPGDHATLPAVVVVDAYEWHGSDLNIDALAGDQYRFDDDMRACGACGSTNVRCIFLHCFHHIVESDVRVELACAACGKYTVHAFERL